LKNLRFAEAENLAFPEEFAVLGAREGGGFSIDRLGCGYGLRSYIG
jgi:hypothetical protein